MKSRQNIIRSWHHVTFWINPRSFVKLQDSLFAAAPWVLAAHHGSLRSRTNRRKKQKGLQAHGFDMLLAPKEEGSCFPRRNAASMRSWFVSNLFVPAALCKWKASDLDQNSQQWGGKWRVGDASLPASSPDLSIPIAQEQLNPGEPTLSLKWQIHFDQNKLPRSPKIYTPAQC